MNSLLTRLKRSTNSVSFIPEIDGLRFYAIITVVIYHLNTAYSRSIGLENLGLEELGGQKNLFSAAWWIVRLDLGVKVFFAISGMVLALPFLKNYLGQATSGINIRDYYYRRLTRLEPPFVLSLVLFFCVHVVLLGKPAQEMASHLGIGLLYAHVPVYGYPNPVNPVTWSLETEAQFYLIVPVLFALVFLFRNRLWSFFLITVLFTGSILSRNFFVIHGIDRLSTSVLAFLSNFITGGVFAAFYIKNTAFFARKQMYWDILGLLSVIAQFYFYKPQHHYLNNLVFNLSVFCMMAAVIKGKLFNRFFTNPWVYVIGGMCYSIYLLHYAFLHLLVKVTSLLRTGLGYQADLLLQVLICVPSVFMISAIYFWLVEKPCMDKNWPVRLKFSVQNWLSK